MKIKTIFSFWLFWRVGLFLFSAFAILILPKFNNTFPYINEMLKSSNLPAWFWQFGNFDGVHYGGIAKDGYIRQFTQAFFPMFPILIRVVSPIFFNNFVLAGVFLSSMFTLLSGWMLVKLVSVGVPHGEPLRKTRWIVAFFLLFPMSFFFGAIYNESFFLFLVFSCFYFAKKRNWLLVGLFGALASGTRLVGIFLLPAMIWEYFTIKNIKVNKYKILNTIYILFIPLGLIIYMLYLQFSFHDGLYFLHAQGAFGASRSTGIVFPLVTIWRYAKILTTVSIVQYNFWVALWEAGFFVGGGVLLTIITILKFKVVTGHWSVTTKNINVSYSIFSWLCFLLPTFTGTLSSFPRYLLVCFPLYIFLGNLSNKYLKIGILIFFLILNSLFSILFLRGYWVS